MSEEEEEALRYPRNRIVPMNDTEAVQVYQATHKLLDCDLELVLSQARASSGVSSRMPSRGTYGGIRVLH